MKKIISAGMLSLLFQPLLAQPAPHNHWYLTLGGGSSFLSLSQTQTTVSNGSGAPSPYDMDTYTMRQKQQPLLNLGVGHRWETGARWLPAYSVGIYYQHFFAADIGNQVMQYSAPDFTNYQYDWKLSSDILLASAKMNIVKVGPVMPYILASLGSAWNRSSGYSEEALPGLTAVRVSPNYQNNTQAQFAYNAGAGLDFQFNDNILISAEYQYQGFGKSSLGKGTGDWSGQSLKMGQYHGNAWLVNFTCLI